MMRGRWLHHINITWHLAHHNAPLALRTLRTLALNIVNHALRSRASWFRRASMLMSLAALINTRLFIAQPRHLRLPLRRAFYARCAARRSNIPVMAWRHRIKQ